MRGLSCHPGLSSAGRPLHWVARAGSGGTWSWAARRWSAMARAGTGQAGPRSWCLGRGRSLIAVGATILATLWAPAAHAQSATYRVTFEGKWTTAATATGVAVPSGAHFSPLIGAVHNAQVTFWSSGDTASAGIESMAEVGGTSTLKSEINANSHALSVIERSDNIGTTATVTVDITLSPSHPLVTLVTMIAPSPDWFVGVAGLSLLDAQNEWLASHAVDLFPYDAGTEDGTAFSLSNDATDPQGTITSITGTGQFSTAPIATLTFTRQTLDYDTDDDGLIDTRTLAQLDAIRHDLNGDGIPTDDGMATYAAAFPDAAEGMGCHISEGCTGYELMADLDFDTDGSGDADAGDAYWNNGAGWTPIGGAGSEGSGDPDVRRNPFLATFEGNGHTIAHLFFDTRRRLAGLFGHTGRDADSGAGSVLRNVGLIDVDVSGRVYVGGLVGDNRGVITDSYVIGLVSGDDVIGGLVGDNYGPITGSYVTGLVSGDNMVGGLVGRNYAVITGSYSSGSVSGTDYVGGLVGNSYGVITASYATGRVAGTEWGIGGLVGSHKGTITASYVTGLVSGDDVVGGLVGDNRGGIITASYATGRVAGTDYVGGLVGSNIIGTIAASYATGRVSGDNRVGGLAGFSGQKTSVITASYATGHVSGNDNVGGLAGLNEGTVTASYWDTRTSGQPTGTHGEGRTTTALQAPTDYRGIYRTWNLDLDGLEGPGQTANLAPDSDGVADDPWAFGTAAQYPVLAVDVNGDGRATWQEFGYQLRAGPSLTAAAMDGQTWVDLSWTAADASPWSPAPDITYTLTRDDGTTVETLAEDLSDLEYTDTDVTVGAAYTYQVAAVVAGGKTMCSAPLTLIAGVTNQAPLAVGVLADRTLRAGDSAGSVEVAEAFRDLEGDALTYGATSLAPAAATVSLSGTRVTLTPVAAGQATVTVTATDANGSNTSATQQFAVTVLPATATDYDTDDDGLIDIRTLAQLDAVRHDLNGDGIPTAAGATKFAAAFPDRVACGGFGCVGYELRADLDFDTDGSGAADAGDTHWNDGVGWAPIGELSDGFATTFEGNGQTVSNLLIRGGRGFGLFGATAAAGIIRNVGVIAIRLSGGNKSGGLVGDNGGTITGSYATGRVSGNNRVGGLVGHNRGAIAGSYARVRVSGNDNVGGLVGHNSGAVSAGYATGRVSGKTRVGGLVGYNNLGAVSASYATARVSGKTRVGGLIGDAGSRVITASYWDTRTSGHATGTILGEGRTTEQLQAPTDDSGTIYADWNVDRDDDVTDDDPWDFGTESQYPALQVNFDGQGTATWQEFGYQLRTGPTLTVTGGRAQAMLNWTAVDVRPWHQAPTVTYTVYRDPGTTVETVIEGLDGVAVTDTNVPAGAYTYQVAAVVDGGEAARSGLVAVTVAPPNRPPAFSASTITRHVAEDRSSGQAIDVPVSATDADSDALTYTLGGPDGTTFRIDESSGQLQVGAGTVLDYETRTTYSVAVTASDDDASATVTVTIRVTDVNEPVEAGADHFTLPEDTAPALHVLANDTDPEGVTLTPEVSTHPGNGVAVVATNGRVLYTPAAHYHGTDSFTYTVSDGTFTATALVTLTITPVNDAPAFSVASLHLTVEENNSATQVIGQVTATDVDATTLTYTLGGADAILFTIDAVGQLQPATVLNYEAPQDQNGDNTYEVIVTVSDSAVAATLPVTITVTNSDEAGQLRLPTLPLVTVAFPATLDEPDGPVRAVTWQWARSLTLDNWGDIDGATAATYTPVADDEGYYSQVRVTYRDVHVADAQPPKALSAVSAQKVAKRDVNLGPELPDGPIPLSVAENTAPGTVIGQVAATDLDDRAEDLAYSLSGPDARFFAIASGAAGGALTVGAGTVLDYETTRAYRVTVTVEDPFQATDSVAVTIAVEDVNEAPAFGVASATRTVVEHTPTGQALGRPLTATDDDADPLTYTLDPASAAIFAIDERTGQLRTKAKVDYEARTTYFVTVTVTDDAEPPATDSIAVTITVTDAPGTVTLSPMQPQVGTPLTATLSADPDDLATSAPTWVWEGSADQQVWQELHTVTTLRTSPSEATASYTPRTAGGWLRVRVTYTDGDGREKTLGSAASQTVLAGRPSSGGSSGFGGGGSGGVAEEEDGEAERVGYLENPGPSSFQSGVGVLSGWVCEAAMVEIAIADLPAQVAGYGTERLDTASVCGDVDNGFGLLFNWNRLDDGAHTVVALVDGVALAQATVTVTTLGYEFLRGAEGECVAEDFPLRGETVTLEWQQNSQNFVIAGGSPPVGGNPGSPASVRGALENPGPNSFQSGVGVLSGWVCEADTVEIAIGDFAPQVAAYGTERFRHGGRVWGHGQRLWAAVQLESAGRWGT